MLKIFFSTTLCFLFHNFLNYLTRPYYVNFYLDLYLKISNRLRKAPILSEGEYNTVTGVNRSVVSSDAFVNYSYPILVPQNNLFA